MNKFPAQLWQVVRSGAVGVRRNGPLAAAAIVSSFVALTLLGASLLVQRGVENATVRWRGGVETIVFLEPTAPKAEIERIGAAIKSDDRVAEVRFVSQQEALEEFRVMFRNSPELVASVDSSVLPASWRIVPRQGVPEEQVDALGQAWELQPSVYQVVSAKDAVQTVNALSSMVRTTLMSVAIAVAVAAMLMAVASCRSAAHARRDELAVMRLVGAPRWVVRWPFILEGAVTGLIGGWAAAMAVEALARLIHGRVAGSQGLTLVKNFSVTSGDVWAIGLQLVVVGTAVGAFGAALAVTRYVRASEGVAASWWQRRRDAHHSAELVLTHASHEAALHSRLED
jgi:cell division transport system permease protein